MSLSNPLRILFAHERFGDVGGAETNIRATASELARRGHEVGLFHGPHTGHGQSNWDTLFPWKASWSEMPLERAVKDFSPDVIYLHKTDNMAVLEPLLTSGVPVVRMVHDHDLYCMRSYKYDYFSRKICTRPASGYCVFPCLACAGKNSGGGFPIKWQSLAAKQKEISLNRKFDRMVVAGEFMKGELVKNGFSPDRISIQSPVPAKAAKAPESQPTDRNLVLYVGQIIRGKGVDVLLESLALVKSPFECVILGEGSHRAYCEELAKRLGIADRVIFKGFVAQEELQAYYREASVMAVSSVWPEPFGMIGLEAMRHALPVVAFDAGGIREWLSDKHNGHLIPWMDRRAYAAGIDALLTDKETAMQMGRAGWAMAEERYNFGNYIDGLENLFHEAVADAPQVRSKNLETLELAAA